MFRGRLVELAKREATAPPELTAPKRTKKKSKDGEEDGATGFRRLSELDGEAPLRGFNTEAERLAARSRRIEAIRAIAPGARARERETLARLYDIPRVRAITGNLVSLDTDYSKTVTVDDFISHDVSALTNLDAEILAGRPDKSLPKQRKARNDRQGAGRSHKSEAPPKEQSATPNRRRRSRG